jgi:hypothetical protein
MSKTARMIMYPLLVVVIGFFVYATFIHKPAPKQVQGTQETTQQVQTQTTTNANGK